MEGWQMGLAALIVVTAVPLSIWRLSTVIQNLKIELSRVGKETDNLLEHVKVLRSEAEALRKAADKVTLRLDWGDIPKPRGT